ncbi:hypothetical protein A9Q96_14940 [Rhodobacterales bacterium 52_120_T64]|nr:hypothetical protein A9Q96_14940 [Rhodobacterales bacterium 52_120_T64]
MDKETKNGVPPAAAGPAGAEFEVKVGSSYLLSMLADAPARGLPGSTIEKVSFQQGDDGFPMDDVIVTARSSSGEIATLEIQAKRSITFAPKDAVFKKVMSQVVDSVKKEGFWKRDAQLAIATHQASRQITGPYQEVLSWARETDTEKSFFARLRRKGTASPAMKSFVSTFRNHLSTYGAKHEDIDVWRLLKRFQILIFDFSKESGAEDYWAIDRAKGLLVEKERDRASSLWSSIITIGLATDTVAGVCNRAQLLKKLSTEGFELEARWGARAALSNLAEASGFAMDDVSGSIKRISIPRHDRLEAVHTSLSKGRYLEIQGGSGVGKSAIMKRYISQMGNSRSVVFLSPNRTTAGGWQELRHKLEFCGNAKEFLTEVSASGSSIICIDNLDFFSERERVTVKDLVRAAKDVPGVQIIATSRTRLEYDEPNWLPADILDELGHAPVVTIGELSDQEVNELTAEDPKLAALLKEDHPAERVARNLFRLSRLALLQHDDSRLHTEVDLVKIWWKTGDGRDDDSRRDRQRLLTSMAQHYTQSIGLFSSAEYSTSAIQQLVGSETLLDHGNDQVSFKHDVLREWAVASLYDFQRNALETIDLGNSGSQSLLRSYELQTQMMLESGDKPGWVERIKKLSQSDVHRSWQRVTLLAIVHSEASSQLLKDMTAELLADEANIAQQLVALVIASESQSLQEAFSEFDGKLSIIPAGVVAPKNLSWGRLVVWLLTLEQIPNQLIPVAVDLMRNWMIVFVGGAPFGEAILTRFYDFLIRIENAKYCRSFQDQFESFDGQLSSAQMRNLEENLRIQLCMFADKAPALAVEYLTSISGRNVPDHIVSKILKISGTLAKAAPKELSDLTRNALIADQSSGKRHREDYDQGLSDMDSKFMPASPVQGPFFELLTHCPEEGVRLVNELVNHVVDFQIDKRSADEDTIVVPFDAGERSFRYSQSFQWSRHSDCYSVTSALMALEAWGHRRIENGDKPSQVVLDILGSENASVAVLTVAVDVLLSTDQTTFADIMPFLASPELVAMDRFRPRIQDPGDFDLFGLSSTHQEPAGEVSKSYLKGKASRQTCLENVITQFISRAGKEMCEALTQRLQAASDRLGQPELGIDYADPRLMAMYLRCQLDLQNYEETEILNEKGEPVEMMVFKAPPELSYFTAPLDQLLKKSNQRIEENQIELNAGSAVEDPSKGNPEFAAKAASLAMLKKSDDKQSLDFIAAAAVLVLRDGDAELNIMHGDWAVAKLSEFGTQDGDYHDGAFSFLRYNRAALALNGLSCALTTPLSDELLRSILATVAKHPRAIAPGLRNSLEKLTTADPKILKSIVRVAIAGCIYPWRHWRDETEYEARKTRSTARIGKTIDAEINWVLNGEKEPGWPELPPTEPKIRRGIRIGGKSTLPIDELEITNVDEVIPNPDHLIFDDSSVARIVMATTLAARPDWLLEILDVFWPFTQIKNGTETDGERVDPPQEWNDCYYALLAEAPIVLAKQDAHWLVKERLIALPDEGFISAVSPFLQHLDDMTFGDATISVELAVEYRAAVAERLIATTDWRYLVGDTSDRMSVNFRPAISSLFYNSASAYQPLTSRLLEPGVRRLDPAIPLLVKCISSAPSYAVAVFIMNLVEVKFMPSHKPMVLALATSCLKNGIVDREFWISTGMGAKVCSYFDKLLSTISDRESVALLGQELDDIVNQLILIGVPEAQRLHDALTARSS